MDAKRHPSHVLRNYRLMYMKTLKTTLVILLLALTGCDQKSQTAQPQKPDGPSAAAVQSFIQQNIPSYLTVQNVKVESFIDPALMRGRLSVAGELVLNETLYKEISENDLIQMNNVNSSDYSKYKQGPTPDVARPTTLKGQVAAFQAEYGVAKSVNGWTLDGDLQIPRVFDGQLLNSLRGCVLPSDPQVSLFFDIIRNKSAEEKAQFTQLNTAIKKAFARGTEHKCYLIGRADIKFEPPFIMTVETDPIIVDNGRDIYKNLSFNFKTTVSLKWLGSKIIVPPGMPGVDYMNYKTVEISGRTLCPDDAPIYQLELKFPTDRPDYFSEQRFSFNGKQFGSEGGYDDVMFVPAQ